MNEGAPMAQVTVELPTSITRSLKIPASKMEQEIKKELAVALYARRALAFSKAAELAELSHVEFGHLLSAHQVNVHYDELDLANDLRYANSDN